jgi:hypothetical protein
MVIHCPWKPDENMNGIIAHLARENGENVHDKGAVTVTAKSVHEDPSFPGCYHPRHLVTLDRLRQFMSADEPDQWICWDFHDIRIHPTHYEIQGPGGGAAIMRSWVVESSTDGVEWVEIDRQIGDMARHRRPALETFQMATLVNCRFIRLTQIGTNGNDSNVLAICTLELYGWFVRSDTDHRRGVVERP